MTRVFLDTAVLAYALGGEHPQRSACRALVQAAGDGRLVAHVSVEAVQELAFHRMRRTTRGEAVDQARAVLDLCQVHPVDESVVRYALDLVAATALRGRDAVHAATALLAGFDAIVTPDADFDAVPGLRRVDPADALPG